MVLDYKDATVMHVVNKEPLTCEALRYKEQDKAFNSIGWFSADSTIRLISKFQINEINADILNYTSMFPYESNQLQNNSVYKCCTLYNEEVRSCQRFLAYIYTPPTTTTTTTTSTTTTTTATLKPINLANTKDRANKIDDESKSRDNLLNSSVLFEDYHAQVGDTRDAKASSDAMGSAESVGMIKNLFLNSRNQF